MDKSLIETLVKLGLTTKEAKVYLSTLEIGSSPVSKIAQNAGINRISTYDIIEKLLEKGLITKATKNKIKYFTGTDPEMVIEEFEKKAISLKNALPKLKQFNIQNENATVSSFEGKEGLKNIFNTMLTSKNEICCITGFFQFEQEIKDLINDFENKRVKKKIPIKITGPIDKDTEFWSIDDEKNYRQIRYLPIEELNPKCDTYIFDGKIVIINYGEKPQATQISNTETYETYLSIFNHFYATTETIEKNSANELKTKMLNPLSEDDLKKSLEEYTRPLKRDKKELKESNLSLF